MPFLREKFEQFVLELADACATIRNPKDLMHEFELAYHPKAGADLDGAHSKTLLGSWASSDSICSMLATTE
eukprot:2793700-Pyramimonas_sp.AAC.1